MMSQEQFNKLKHGDVLLWRCGKSALLRTVIDGPADESYRGKGITFAIRRRSWTGRAVTHYGWNDIKRRIRLVKRTGFLMLSGEAERLRDIGFNVRKELAREVREMRAMKLRMGRELCKRKFSIPL